MPDASIERRERVKDLFIRAQAAAPDERARILDEAGSDLELRKEVEELLNDYTEGSFRGFVPNVAEILNIADSPAFTTGEMVADRYRVVRLLGRGGMELVADSWHFDVVGATSCVDDDDLQPAIASQAITAEVSGKVRASRTISRRGDYARGRPSKRSGWLCRIARRIIRPEPSPSLLSIRKDPDVERHTLQLYELAEDARNRVRDRFRGHDGESPRPRGEQILSEDRDDLSQLRELRRRFSVGDVEEGHRAELVTRVAQPCQHRLHTFSLRDYSVRANEQQSEVRIDVETHRHDAFQR